MHEPRWFDIPSLVVMPWRLGRVAERASSDAALVVGFVAWAVIGMAWMAALMLGFERATSWEGDYAMRAIRGTWLIAAMGSSLVVLPCMLFVVAVAKRGGTTAAGDAAFRVFALAGVSLALPLVALAFQSSYTSLPGASPFWQAADRWVSVAVPWGLPLVVVWVSAVAAAARRQAAPPGDDA